MTTHPIKRRKKLIEVSIPLEAINSGAASEQGKRHQNPSTLHLWWSRKPMGTARAILFCQCVDDPGSVPEEYPTEEEQENERLRLHAIAARLAKWESYSDTSLLSVARAEMISTWKRCCNDNSKHPEASKLFNPDLVPGFCDPFSGGGVIPLEAQRMGLASLALDLNPVSVLINKCLIDFPTRFSGMQPVNPAAGLRELSIASQRNGSKGLHEDCLFYGMALGELVESKIRNLYPEVVITNEMAAERSDLRDLVGQSLKVFTWIWTRTVPSPNPLYKATKVPLASKFWLSTKNGSEAYVEPIIEAGMYYFRVRKGKPKDLARVKKGTSISRGNFRCILSGDPIGYKYIDNEASLGNVGYRLMAIVLIGPRGKIYIDPDAEHEKLALTAVPAWRPSEPSRGTWASNAQGRRYGCQVFGDYFLPRQLCTLNAFCDNLEAIKQRVWSDAEKAGLDSEPISIEAGGRGAQAYAEAITIYLSLAIDRFADYWTSFGRWQPANQQLSNTFSVQGIAMAWDFPEANPFSGKGGSFKNLLEWTLQSLPTLGHGTPGKGEQADAGTLRLPDKVIVSTDPPYYDNVGYSDLSDFFYCWLKKNLKHLYPSLFGTITTPKFNEIFACSTRHGGRDEAEHFFLNAMTQAMTKLTEIIHPCYPATIYYAFKQSEAKNSGGVYSTGWETFLEAIVNAGMTINSTWPLRTEMANRMASIDSNSLSASILLVCEARSVAPVAVSRADFRRRLRARLADAMKLFKRAGILPVDIAQSVIGTGFSLYSGAEQVINPDDSPMSVRDALIEINSALDTYLGEDEADLDSETRLALTFFESYGYEERPYGDAEGLAIARNLSVDGVAEAGILSSVAGKVRLYQRAQLPDDWDPTTDRRLCVWEATQHLINRLEASGEGAAAELLLQLKNVSGHGDLAANCRALAYRLYNHCEKKKLAEEARSYNGLVIAWPELERLASASSTSSSAPRQTTLI